jgi:hypothetical protein
MKVTPKTEEQISQENLLPAGIYPFEIMEAIDQISKSNNEMIKLSIRIWDAEGGERFVYDYLLDSIAYKVRHCAYACELSEQYESGTLMASDFIGKTGSLKLGIRKDKSGQYPDQNQVNDYIVNEHATGVIPESVRSDEIPFG